MGPDKQNFWSTGLDIHMYKISERKIVNIFLPISFKICFGCSKIRFGCSKEPSHWDGSFEYPQHMFWLTNKKKFFFVSTVMAWADLKLHKKAADLDLVSLCWWSLSKWPIFQSCWDNLLSSWVKPVLRLKQQINCFAQGHNTLHQVSRQLATLRSPV